MKTGTEHTPAEFDQILALALLERNDVFNESNNTTMSQHMINSDEVPALHNMFVAQKLARDFKSRKIFLNSWIVLLLATAVATIGIWQMNKTASTVAVTDTPATPPAIPQQTILTANDSHQEKNKRVDEEMVMPVTADSVAETEHIPEEIILPAHFAQGHTFMHIPEEYVDEEAEVPVLSESQKKLNGKRKLQMFRDINKRNTFPVVKAGPAWRNGERFEVSEFRLEAAEVSNWQYTVFLNDLILQGRTDDYLACRPAKGNWKAVGIPEFEESYPGTEGYEKFPVLNITRAAAEMYCEWFTLEMGKAIDNKEIKWNRATKPDFRLPSDVEWLRAARGDHDSTMQFPWGYKFDALQNSKGCYMCNFNYGISKDVLTPIEADGKNCISEKKSTRSIITTAGRAIDTLVLGPEYCYNPTDFGHYCMMGNAAEMVWTYDATQPAVHGAARAMGGSWCSHADNVRIESKEQFEGVTDPNVNIGFRCVMVYK